MGSELLKTKIFLAKVTALVKKDICLWFCVEKLSLHVQN